MLDRMGNLVHVFGGEKALRKQLGGKLLAAQTLTSLARACKWSDFLGHTNPISARADLLLTKVHDLEILFCGTGVVYAPGEVEQFAARHPSIPQANGTYLTDMITVRQELLPYHKRLLRGRYRSRAFALPCNRSKCTRGHDE